MKSSLLAIVTFTLAATIGSTASAQPAPPCSAQTDSRPTLDAFDSTPNQAPEFTAGDWVLSTLSGDAGLAVGGVAGGYLGWAMAGGCSAEERSEPFGCLGSDIGGFLGMVTLAPVGTATGVYLYGEGRGHNGSYWAALGGSAVGLGAVGAIALGDYGDRERVAILTAATLILPALASTTGYYLSRDTSPRPRHLATSGALLDLGRDGVVRLGVPNLSISTDPSARAASLTLFGGAL